MSITPNQISSGIDSILSVSFNSAAQHNSLTKLVGTITCGTEVRDIDIEILSLSILPRNSTFATAIPVSSKTQIMIPIASVGFGSHNFDFKIDGPLSRLSLIHISEPTRPY